MIENDFSALRSAVYHSVIGQTLASLTTAMGGAVATASATRVFRSNADSFRGLAASETIKLSAVALMTACLATWALARVVPLYASTAIPGSAWLVIALACGAAAASAHTLGDQWSRSRTRRVTEWLRGA